MDGLQIGRNVHYVVAEGEHRVALITKVWNDSGVINLSYFNDGSYDVQHGNTAPVIMQTSITHSEQPLPGSWHWIERA